MQCVLSFCENNSFVVFSESLSLFTALFDSLSNECFFFNWAVSSEFSTYRLCEQRRFRWACASAQSRQNLRCSLIQAVSQEEPSDRKPDPWPLWMAGHAQLKFVMMECSKTQIRLTRHNCGLQNSPFSYKTSIFKVPFTASSVPNWLASQIPTAFWNWW